MNRRFFVTGTDTEVGKTFVSCALLEAFNGHRSKPSTVAYKPVAAGAERSAEGWRNEDGLALQQYCSVQLSYEQVNPVVYPEAIAPHIAAELNQCAIDEALINRGLDALDSLADITLVEGAGGWEVPFKPGRHFSDWVCEQQLPVVLVVGVKLGCLNHALLTAQAIRQRGLKLLGWVANMVETEDPVVQQNVAYLRDALDCDCLGVVPKLHEGPAADAACYLDVENLLRQI